MKVCTDACLLSAFAANRLPLTVHHILDIGTGTGLLSLMLAQKKPNYIIDAIEIDEAAAKQARENFDNSPWKERLKINNISIQQYANITLKKYDVIICNPPFYEKDLKSENIQRNVALHSDALLLEELTSIVNLLLANDGNFFVLLPYHRTKYFEELLLKNKLRIKEKVFIKHTPEHNYFRIIFWVDRIATTLNQSEINIMNDKNEYSEEFSALLKDYYLKL